MLVTTRKTIADDISIVVSLTLSPRYHDLIAGYNTDKHDLTSKLEIPESNDPHDNVIRSEVAIGN